eukprot:GEZU01024334.1.p1 GENE.GEZU01024334.1~~GEZU01024334.1.p1  ORF type:complete len:332 (+),score=118.30 GEZU01024334.1:184-1179(+)
MVAKALYDGLLMGIRFSIPFLKRMCSIPTIDIEADMKLIDPEFYERKIRWILEYPLPDVPNNNNVGAGVGDGMMDMDLTFSEELYEFGVHKIVELCKDGNNIRVTDANKRHYVRLLCERRIVGDVQEQIESFLVGVEEIIPLEWLTVFNPNELDFLISGGEFFTNDNGKNRDAVFLDWKNNTSYERNPPLEEDKQVIEWFWEIVRDELNDEQRRALMAFTTGSPAVPFGGFANLSPNKFTICVLTYNKVGLPMASTCYNRLKLRRYATRDELKTKLLMATTSVKLALSSIEAQKQTNKHQQQQRWYPSNKVCDRQIESGRFAVKSERLSPF